MLILDDLPVSSYMEKGVLADLTKFSGKLSKEGVLIDVIGNTAQKDGKVYALPARIKVPVVYGTKEEKEACASMQSLSDYAQKHPDTRLFGRTTHDLIGMTLFHMLYDEIQDKGQKLDEKKLAEEFVAMLFSETVQKTDNMSGLFVTEKGLDALVEKTKLPENEQFCLAFSGVDPETGEEFQDEYTCLSPEEMKSLIQLVKGLRTPFISDRVVTDTVLAEMEKCYRGSQTAAETAASICQKVGTYLSE